MIKNFKLLMQIVAMVKVILSNEDLKAAALTVLEAGETVLQGLGQDRVAEFVDTIQDILGEEEDDEAYYEDQHDPEVEVEE